MSTLSIAPVISWLIGLLVLSVGIVLYVLKKMTKSPIANIIRYEAEYYFRDPAKGTQEKFPSLLTDPASVDLSVIVPAYNEQKRLPKMLDECVEFLEARRRESDFTYEVIVVDDGSRDNTSEVALTYSTLLGVERVRLLTLSKNRGKGGAIRLGVISSRGRQILFADGDGATKFSDLEHMEVLMEAIGKDSIVVGSRAHLEKRAVAERSVFRTFLMKGFHVFVWLFGVRDVKDTQCGFKLFSRSAASKCFFNLHVERWAFDIELLYIAEVFSISIREVAVNWQEIEGSKLIPVFSWIQMALDILRMRTFYLFGIWKVDTAVTGKITHLKDKSL